jgi:dihydropyrimidinase
MQTLIKNGQIVTAVDDYHADILINDGRIETIGRSIAVGADVEVHDAAGLLVLPGGVDVHTHLDWAFGPSQTVDTFGSGTKAAAFGGTTTLIDFCNQTVGESPLLGLERWHKRRESACVDVGAHMIMLDVNADSLEDMKLLIRNEGVSSFKLFMAYPGVLMLDDGAIFKAMRVAGANGALTCVHAENGPVIDVLVREALEQGLTSPKYHATTRPTILEGEATHRAIRLSELAGAPLYIVHLSASEALASVTEARDRGIPIHAETCPHYLFLTNEEYDRPGFDAAKYVMTPPLRDTAHQQQLWRGLKTDDLQVVSTDHCPFCFNAEPYGLKFSKQLGAERFSEIPNGAPGVETRLPLVFEGAVLKHGMSINRFVEITSTAPAKLFGLFPKKGTIAIGTDGDIVLFDPTERWTIRAAEHHSRMDHTLYEGRPVTGRVKKVFLRGQCIVDGATWRGREGMGQFLRRDESGRL